MFLLFSLCKSHLVKSLKKWYAKILLKKSDEPRFGSGVYMDERRVYMDERRVCMDERRIIWMRGGCMGG